MSSKTISAPPGWRRVEPDAVQLKVAPNIEIFQDDRGVLVSVDRPTDMPWPCVYFAISKREQPADHETVERVLAAFRSTAWTEEGRTKSKRSTQVVFRVRLDRVN